MVGGRQLVTRKVVHMYKYSVVYTDTVDVKTEFKNEKRRKKNSGEKSNSGDELIIVALIIRFIIILN